MPTRKRIDDATKSLVLGLRSTGLRVKDICADTGLSVETVKHILRQRFSREMSPHRQILAKPRKKQPIAAPMTGGGFIAPLPLARLMAGR